MSDRFLTFLDLDVKAPVLIIPVDLGGGVKVEGVVERALHEEKQDGGEEKEQVGSVEREEEGRGLATAGDQEERLQRESNVDGHGDGGGGSGRGASRASEGAVSRELLIVDLGSISLTTARLAQHHRQEVGEASVDLPAVATTEDDGTTTSNNNGSGGSSGGSDPGGLTGAVVPQQGRRQPTSDVEFAVPAGGGNGGVIKRQRIAGESWHAKFYDVYKVEVDRIGVMLLAGCTDSSGGGRGIGGAGEEDVAKKWLVDPFDVKVSWRSFAAHGGKYSILLVCTVSLFFHAVVSASLHTPSYCRQSWMGNSSSFGVCGLVRAVNDGTVLDESPTILGRVV